MTISEFIDKLIANHQEISFQEIIETIDMHYNFTPTQFTNGNQENKAGENSGSCKLFSFAKLHNLNKEQTLLCFGDYYKGVLNTPDGTDHQNIRNFIKTGWEGISFAKTTLSKK
ncbi:HopJ type III effector protein [Aquimarina sp. RZ0]|uniref:HopJ type III effector protein n=1 Tax=Aquimarina sp. RZ0 TaxID=2607730 RepID=UPI0011F100F6|nr:HopJ type III effector protein [Aquimarina sp. RZ0]KAA1247313.1 HopJ type III effector protein [Aquimarina sp. RZ0]